MRLPSLFLLALIVGCDDSGTPVLDAGLSDAGLSDAGRQDTGPNALDAGEAADAGTTNGDVPLIGDALPCTPEARAPLPAGEDLRKATLTDPAARCNDGSPAIVYVHRSEVDTGDWLVHLQGGSSCLGPACAARWCEEHEKMTSTIAPDGILGAGIFAPDPRNAFASRHQVFVYYCSSDTHAGRRSDVVVPASRTAPRFRMHYAGDAIVNAVFDALEAGLSSDDGSESLPPLGTGANVLLTGSSAGCLGVAHQGDRTAARLRDLGATPHIACDGNFGPLTQDLPPGPNRDAYIERRRTTSQARSELQNPHRDESCVAAHPEEVWQCDGAGYVLGEHLQDAPLFVRADLRDGVVGGGYTSSGFSITEYAEGVRSGLLNLAADGARSTPASVFGLACGEHTALRGRGTEGAFFRPTFETMSLHQALRRWLAGEQVVEVDTVPPSRSRCAR